MKRNVLGILAVSSLLTLTACGGGASAYEDYIEEDHTKPTPIATDGGKVLNIRCWNDEFEQRFENYYPGAKSLGNNTYTIPSKSGSGTVTSSSSSFRTTAMVTRTRWMRLLRRPTLPPTTRLICS